ncbi:MAG: hypothetical protein U5N55_10775 [Cypionkella sp.]|nr:hypothetical protein [Cypionkella sp.]
MAGNTIWRGQAGAIQPTTVNLPVTGALLPGTFVESTATNLVQLTTAIAKLPKILGFQDYKDQDNLAAYVSGDTGVAYDLRPGDVFQVAMASATYTLNQPLTVAASGRAAAAGAASVVVAFFADTPGAYSAGQLADVIIANSYTAA